MLEHIERLKTFQLVDLPEGPGRHIHQNRLLKLAREGGQMTPKTSVSSSRSAATRPGRRGAGEHRDRDR